jgi:hypothetical protein
VWPEVPAPFSLQDPNCFRRARPEASRAIPRADFLVGVVDWKRDAAGQWKSPPTRAVLLDPAGQQNLHLR